MNLTGRPVYAKGQKRRSRGKARAANANELAHWERVAALPCIAGPCGCNYNGRPVTLHHCGTRRGGRKNHMKVIPLCWEHHLGHKGVDGKRMSFAEWQKEFGTEEILLTRVTRRLQHWKEN